MGLTGAMYKSLRFDGEDSRDYGVYITGEAVFNSPERDVEMISIPGRNGEYARDLGRFTNIEVTYPAGLFGVDEADFADAIADFRNMLGSRVGYCRLEDDYNPGEYRMGVFKAGLEVEPANLKSGEFTITFNCKPQRFLASGETATELQSGDTITNPTLFESRPMLQIWGYGGIDLGGQEISIANISLGRVLLANGETGFRPDSLYYTFPETSVNVGDSITITEGSVVSWSVVNIDPSEIGWSFVRCKNVSVTSDPDMIVKDVTQNVFGLDVVLKPLSLTAGTGKLFTFIVEGTMVVENGGTFADVNFGVEYTIRYMPLSPQSVIGVSYQYTITPGYPFIYDTSVSHKFSSVYGMSTKSTIGAPAYIDLDIGEAFYIDNDEPISINNVVTIPAILPTLPPGATTITFDNTITQFKVVPRWWKL